MPEEKKVTPATALRRKHEAETQKLMAEADCLRAEAEVFKYEAENNKWAASQNSRMETFNRSSDAANRTYTLTDVIAIEPGIHLNTVEEISESVNGWARMGNAPIIVRLNSPGGSVHAGLAIYDQLKSIDQFKAPVYTVAMGMTASMASILFQAGRRRIITPNAVLLIHEVSVEGFQGTRSQMEDEMKVLHALNSRLMGILAERASIPKEEISKRAERKDWVVEAEEAVALGLADEIGYE